ncbi:unnamed protein product, partial [Prorocentrum cordatum]
MGQDTGTGSPAAQSGLIVDVLLRRLADAECAERSAEETAAICERSHRTIELQRDGLEETVASLRSQIQEEFRESERRLGRLHESERALERARAAELRLSEEAVHAAQARSPSPSDEAAGAGPLAERVATLEEQLQAARGEGREQREAMRRQALEAATEKDQLLSQLAEAEEEARRNAALGQRLDQAQRAAATSCEERDELAQRLGEGHELRQHLHDVRGKARLEQAALLAQLAEAQEEACAQRALAQEARESERAAADGAAAEWRAACRAVAEAEEEALCERQLREDAAAAEGPRQGRPEASREALDALRRRLQAAQGRPLPGGTLEDVRAQRHEQLARRLRDGRVRADVRAAAEASTRLLDLAAPPWLSRGSASPEPVAARATEFASELLEPTITFGSQEAEASTASHDAHGALDAEAATPEGQRQPACLPAPSPGIPGAASALRELWCAQREEPSRVCQAERVPEVRSRSLAQRVTLPVPVHHASAVHAGHFP